MTLVVFIAATNLFSQAGPKWATDGNSASSGNFLGTTNAQPLLFRTNNLSAMTIAVNGQITMNSLSSFGSGVVTHNNNGTLITTPFPNDTNTVLTGSGQFRSVTTLSGWTRIGTHLYNSNTGNVGIGTSSPQYLLDVNGDAWFSGTVYAMGIILTNKLLTDTVKATSMFSLNNTLFMRGGGLSEMYTTSGDLRIQSQVGYSGNTVMHAGTSGNVGIGTFTPQYKLDVNGDVNLSGRTYVYRFISNNGDSSIRFGDSTMILNYGLGNILNNSTTGAYKGMGIGVSAFGSGLHSTALGYRVRANGVGSIIIGSVDNASTMFNNIPSSLMIGFNSNIPTIFVGPGIGNGTLGKVGIGTTTPTALFQVENGINRIVFDQSGSNAMGFASYIGFNVHRDPASGWYKTIGDGALNNSGSTIFQDSEGALRFYVFGNTGNGADQTVDPIHLETQSIMTLRPERVQIGQAVVSTGSPFNDASTKLSVDGRILCKDLVVTAVDWQDEVFDSTYILMPLDSVAGYIATNKHLPGVKAESEIENNGMSVVETAEVQQKKIEELMLYILQLDKRMKVIEAENAKLKEEQNK